MREIITVSKKMTESVETCFIYSPRSSQYMDLNPVPIGCNVYHSTAETEIHHNIKQTINIVFHAIFVVFYGHSSTLKSVIGIFWQHLFIERLRA